MSKGTVVLLPFPFTDFSGNKIRPCLVLYEQKGGEDCIVACISSQKQARLYAWDVRVNATSANGLKVDSIIKMDKIATLEKKIVLGELGTLEATSLKMVNACLKKMFGLT